MNKFQLKIFDKKKFVKVISFPNFEEVKYQTLMIREIMIGGVIKYFRQVFIDSD